MNNENTQKELISILNKLKINDDELDELLMKKSEDKTIFTDKIMKVLEKYEDDPTSTLARIIGKHCKRESLNNITKRRILSRLKKTNIAESAHIKLQESLNKYLNKE